nr:hypothetical protein [Tanacetum cinerariifolium]
DLGHSGDIIYLTYVNVDYLHQPWREFATVINKCPSGKETGMDKTRLSRVPDEQHLKTTSADEGTGTIPRVPDVPIYESESEKESWGESGEEDEDDENNYVDKSDGNDGASDDHDVDSDDERTKSNRDEIPDPNLTNVEQTKQEEEEYSDQRDDVTKELYKDVNVNLGNEDTKMTDADQGGSGQHNVSQESGFEQVEEDAHVTLTLALEIKNTDEPIQSSSVSFEFTSKFLNLENPSPANNEIALLMETSARQATEFLKSHLVLLKLFLHHLTILDRYMDNKLGEAIHKAIQSHNAECIKEAQVEKQEYIDNVDSTVRIIIKEEVKIQLPKILPKEVSAFATLVIERNVTESLEAVVLARSSSQPKLTYDAATSLFEFELTKILLDKMEENNSHLRADYKKKLYNALVESYNTDKIQYIWPNVSVRSLQTSIVDSRSLRPSSYPLGFFINNDLEYLKGIDLSRRYSTSVTKTKVATYKIKWIEDLVRNLWSPVKDVYSRKRIIAVTRLSIMKKYDYGHLEEIEVRQEDKRLYRFRKGDFP